MNELMNDEAVYRTAPATPGLLKKISFTIQDELADERGFLAFTV